MLALGMSVLSRSSDSPCFSTLWGLPRSQETVNPCLSPGAWGPRKERVGEGLAEKVGKGLAKGWRRVGEGLAKGWRRGGEGLADFLAPSNFGIPEAPV